jgi:hypothetical protein
VAQAAAVDVSDEALVAVAIHCRWSAPGAGEVAPRRVAGDEFRARSESVDSSCDSPLADVLPVRGGKSFTYGTVDRDGEPGTPGASGQHGDAGEDGSGFRLADGATGAISAEPKPAPQHQAPGCDACLAGALSRGGWRQCCPKPRSTCRRRCARPAHPRRSWLPYRARSSCALCQTA